MNKEQMQQLKALLREMQEIFRQDADVHQHTRSLGDICRIFIGFDEQHIHSLASAPSINDVAQEILAICPEGQRDNVKTALDSICRAQGADGETGLPLQDLLRRTWALRHIYANGAQLICSNLSHNRETGGGCLPGIAARLVQPYTAFLCNALERPTHASNGLAYSNEEVYNEEQSLALALILSMEDAPLHKPKTGTVSHQEEDDEETQLAKALSLSLNSHQPALRPQQSALFFSNAQQEDKELQAALEQSARDAQVASDEKLARQLHRQLNPF